MNSVLSINYKLVVILVLILSSCKQEKENLVPKGHRSVKLSFVDANINLPNEYVEISIDELIEVWEYAEVDSVFKENKIQWLIQLRDSPAFATMFCDSSNVDNYIYFQKGKHVFLTKEIADQYLTNVQRNLRGSSELGGFNFTKVESKINSGDEAQLIKFKYKFDPEGEERTEYRTQYLFSSKTKTFGMVVSRSDEVDFERLIRDVKILD